MGESNPDKMSYEDFVRTAQCSSPIPDLNGRRGAYDALSMVKLTKKYIETACAHIESNCFTSSKITCPQFIEKAKKNGTYPIHLSRKELYRVKGNKLYLDWPWGQERLQSPMNRLIYGDMRLISYVLWNIKGIGDCFFFFGGEQASFDWRFVVPIFSFAPNMWNSDLPFPWLEAYVTEIKHERKAYEANDYSDDFYYSYVSSSSTSHSSMIPWKERESKAAFFASIDAGSPRQLVYDQAALRPDLFDVSYSRHDDVITPWNLNSDENIIPSSSSSSSSTTTTSRSPSSVEVDIIINNNNSTIDDHRAAGFIQPIIQFETKRTYSPDRYKYIIVPAGAGVRSSSGRLAQLLAHSGAVVLLQEAGFDYPFTARLQPWVHYVPLTYNMADAIDKVEWLVEHDDMAQQIARNARNFGKSYLRVEDYLCYAAMSMHLLSEMQKTDDDVVTEPSNKAMVLIDFN